MDTCGGLHLACRHWESSHSVFVGRVQSNLSFFFFFWRYDRNSNLNSHTHVYLNLWRPIMMVALTIRPRHQLVFGVGGIWTQVPYSTTRDFTSWANWNSQLLDMCVCVWQTTYTLGNSYTQRALDTLICQNPKTNLNLLNSKTVTSLTRHLTFLLSLVLNIGKNKKNTHEYLSQNQKDPLIF